MKIRWRQQEIILVNIIAAILLISFLRITLRTPQSEFAEPFINNHVSFNLYRNLIFPELGMGVLIYFAYMFLSLFAIPQLLIPVGQGTIKIVALSKSSLSKLVKNIIKKYLRLLIQILLIIFILGTAFNFSIYYLHAWQFNYPEFSIFNTSTQKSQIPVLANFLIVGIMMGNYVFYVFIREFIIHSVETSGKRRAFQTVICNQIVLYIVIYFSVFTLVSSFDLVHVEYFGLSYFSLLTPVFLLYLSNTYWLFPAKKEVHFSDPSFLKRLLLSSLACSIPFFLFLAIKSQPGYFFIGYWLFQLFIITPVTWLFYQKRRDEILLFKGAQLEISKSRTDLQFLRSQINPHFLFNVLNTLYGTALQENADRTANGIQKLGDMMRFMLHENNLDFIEMNKETEYLKNYISLQKLRTQSSPDISIEADITTAHCHHRIAPMLLIPLVENAFKHGISLKEKSWIVINLTCDEKNIWFEVRNSMHAVQDNDPEKERSGIGFKNVLERLKLIYPGKFDIAVNGDGKEFFVRLAIQP